MIWKALLLTLPAIVAGGLGDDFSRTSVESLARLIAIATFPTARMCNRQRKVRT
jgi:hypothetical protein